MAEKIVKDSQGLAKDLVNDTISRQAAIDAIFGRSHEIIKMRIGNLPSAQPKSYREGYQAGFKDAQSERERGRWIPNIYPDVGDGYRCSQCGKWHVVKYNFCHNCGADMREVDDERPD